MVDFKSSQNPIAGAAPTPERGFHYFDSPESNDDDEIIAHQYFYCAFAVAEWPEFRRFLEETGAKSAEECDRIEKNAIDIFREFRDAIAIGIETDSMASIAEPGLRERLALAHAYMALHANHPSMSFYQDVICQQMNDRPAIAPPDAGDFAHALWEGKWNEPGEMRPAAVIRKEALRSSYLHANDGLYNTGGRLDPLRTIGDELDSMFAPADELPPLSEMEFAFVSHRLRALGRKEGLSRGHAEFLVRMALGGAQQKDNPTAWRAIRDRRRPSLLPKVEKILELVRERYDARNLFLLENQEVTKKSVLKGVQYK